MTGIGSMGGGFTGIMQDNDDEVNDVPVGAIPQDGYMVNRSGTIVGEKQLYTPLVAVVNDSGTFTADASTGNIFTVAIPVGTGPFTINVPTNLKAGATYMWVITQNAAGNGTIGFPGNFKFPAAGGHTLTASADAVDILTAICTDASGGSELLLVVGQADFR